MIIFFWVYICNLQLAVVSGVQVIWVRGVAGAKRPQFFGLGPPPLGPPGGMGQTIRAKRETF